MMSRRVLPLAILTLLFFTFSALGTWQVARRSWKLDLITRVNAQLQAAPGPALGPAAWSHIGKPDEYRRLRLQGTFRHDLEACTQAVTAHGPGCWVMTPLQVSEGWWLLVNRGFVDSDHRDASTRVTGQVQGAVDVSGLLRLSEPGGGFLRRNDPVKERWTSRDVEAIAAMRGLPKTMVAPYFLDADNRTPGGPVAGLTVVRFRNTHLVYALTWFVLAGLAALGAVLVHRTGAPDDSNRGHGRC